MVDHSCFLRLLSCLHVRWHPFCVGKKHTPSWCEMMQRDRGQLLIRESRHWPLEESLVVAVRTCRSQRADKVHDGFEDWGFVGQELWVPVVRVWFSRCLRLVEGIVIQPFLDLLLHIGIHRSILRFLGSPVKVVRRECHQVGGIRGYPVLHDDFIRWGGCRERQPSASLNRREISESKHSWARLFDSWGYPKLGRRSEMSSS